MYDSAMVRDISTTFEEMHRDIDVDRFVVRGEVYYIMTQYTNKDRHYHNEAHIHEMLMFLYDHEADIPNFREVVMAAIYHDVYMGENAEKKSAEIAIYYLNYIQRLVDHPIIDAGMVYDLIAITEDHALRDYYGNTFNETAAWLLDADLIRLASPNFSAYSDLIRLEYADVPEDIFTTKRKEILRSFLDKPVIYHVESVREKYEALARDNLEKATT